MIEASDICQVHIVTVAPIPPRLGRDFAVELAEKDLMQFFSVSRMLWFSMQWVDKLMACTSWIISQSILIDVQYVPI